MLTWGLRGGQHSAERQELEPPLAAREHPQRDPPGFHGEAQGAAVHPGGQRQRHGGWGVLFGGFARKTDGDSWFTIFVGLIIYQGNPSISPKRTPIGTGMRLLETRSQPFGSQKVALISLLGLSEHLGGMLCFRFQRWKPIPSAFIFQLERYRRLDVWRGLQSIPRIRQVNPTNQLANCRP